MKPIIKKNAVANIAHLFRKSDFYPWILLLGLMVFMSSCKKNDSNPPPSGSYDLRVIAENLVSPVTLSGSPDKSKRLFIVDQVGKIWIINAEGTMLPDPFIDISSKMVSLSRFYDERGLLGLAFHPDFKSNGKFYLFYTAPPRAGGPVAGVLWNNLTRISEFRVSSANPNQADMSSERVILEADHPQGNHNGGTIAFGHDGYLYISIGDGGNKDDIGPGHVNDWYKINAGGNGQDVKQDLLGNILRIDINKRTEKNNYGIPHDNPFKNAPGKNEIYAYGFRNPYRFSFDPAGEHWLFAGDAGQSLYEEINVVKKGGNYGWNVKEGTHCFSTDNDLEERGSCPGVDSAGNPLIDPVIELNNSANPKGGIAISVVGGNVYRGSSIPSLSGKYIFGILSAGFASPTGKLLLSKPSAAGLWGYEDIKLKSFPDNLGQFVKGFGQDEDGEVYTTTSTQIGPQGNTGKVYKLVFVK
ncbi:MAG: PQQ-dependent sugar dehydrogenase [Ginsengibacter sp.]